MGRSRVAFALIAVLVLGASGSGCSTEGMAFRVDDSIDIVAPATRATVELPVTVRWRDHKPAAGSTYAVFVDRAPIRPDATVRGIVEDVERPTPSQLRDRGVIVTDDAAITLEFLEDLRPTSRGTPKDPHEVTIVRMRGDRRIGEAAFRLSFFVRR